MIFTSANAVEAFFERAKAIRSVPGRPGKVYVVGPATGKALRDRGWRPDSISGAHDGASLARKIGPVRGLSILIPRAETARKDLPKILRKKGARVSVAAAYRTVPDREGLKLLQAAVAAQGADWVCFTSGSTVKNFVSAVGPAKAREFFRRARAASIGPVTSSALCRAGIAPAVEASPCTTTDLARKLVGFSRPAPAGELRKTLKRALREAGDIVRRRFRKVRIEYKGKANLITAADRAAEKRILALVLGRFPDHGFLAEESAPERGRSEYTWVIDPIDGTTNYAHGFPVCCVSIGLLHRNAPLMGGVYDPFRDELFFAERGRGTTLNGKRIRVSKARKLSEALLITGFAYDRHKLARYYLGFYRLFMERSHDVRRSGSAALDMAWLAAGRVDGYWEFHLSPWDVAAGCLLVEEAGGTVSDFSGRPWNRPEEYGHETLATNGKLHASMLRIIRKRL